MASKLNLKTIAEMAGVSKVTVSNVLNGKYNRVSKETVERVRKIIEITNYQPSATARSLSLKQSRIIGVVIPYLYKNETFSLRPYTAHMLGFLEQYIRGQGYYMMPRCVAESIDVLPDFTAWNIDGAFVLDLVGEDALRLQDKLSIPSVFIDTYADYASLATVHVDDRKGGYLAAKHLLDRGHRRIAFVGPLLEGSAGVMHERHHGFCEAMREQGVELAQDYHVVTESVLFEHGLEAGKQIAASKSRFTAAAAMADVLAFGVMKSLRQCGKRVPEDVSVVGFDDLPECEYSYPALTSVSQHLEEKARRAGEYLFSLLHDSSTPVGGRKVDVELIERASVKTLETSAGEGNSLEI